MNVKELQAVITDLERLGFVPKSATTKPKHGRKPTPTHDKQAMINKIEAILANSGLHWHYAHGIAKKMFGVDMVHWLDAERLYKVVQALAVYQKRHKGKSQTTKK